MLNFSVFAELRKTEILRMKRFVLLVWLYATLCVGAFAQHEVTKFLGIPVDGSKSEMIRKLKDKGFKTSSTNKEIMKGLFNGKDVWLAVADYKDKVYRIAVSDINGETNPGEVKIRFNNLCAQFEDNKKYYTLTNCFIPEAEDIGYEMTVNQKRYEACYYQRSEQDNSYEELAKRPVWFVILCDYGQYRIMMFYDNVYNQPNGEDL